MRYMIVETFRHGPAPVYARFRERGRMAPEGLTYVDSWVSDDGRRCYQIMDCEDPSLLDVWMAAWQDLVSFEVIPVMSSADARRRFGEESHSLGLESKVVRLAEYDDRWPALFRVEAERLTGIIAAAGLPSLVLEHVGSTSVPGLVAKPILDIAAGRDRNVSTDVYVPVLTEAGYIYRGESGLPGRDFFRLGELRSHHLHLVERGGAHWRRYLMFRDTLRANDALRDEYAAVKKDLARRFPRDREAYIEGKTEIVERILRHPTSPPTSA